MPLPAPVSPSSRADRLGGSGLQRSRLAAQRGGQHLVHGLDHDQLHLAADLVGDVPQVLLVALGEDDDPGAREMGGQDLGLQPADGQDATTQRDLAGHGHVLAHRDARQRADHGRDHGDAGRGAVLGDGSRGHVDVHRVLLEVLALDAQAAGVGADPGEPGPGRLAHHVAQLAGEDEVLLALHAGDLDGHDVAADLCHDQARGCPDLVLGLQLAVLVAPRPEQLR